MVWLDTAFKFGSRGRITPIEYDYLAFSTINLDENMRWLRDRVKAIDPVHETHANPHICVGNSLCVGSDEWLLGRTLDSLSVSIHPSHHFTSCTKDRREFPICYSMAIDKVRSWAGGKDAWVGELQAGTTFYHPEENCFTPSADDISHYLWQAFGHGLKGVLFWEWQSWRSSMMEVGEFSLREAATGAPTERSEAAAEVGRIIKENEKIFRQVRRQSSRTAIFISRSESILKMLQWGAKPYIHGLDHEAAYAVFGCYRALGNANIAVDFVNEDEIERGALKNYRALFMPHVEIMSSGIAAKLKAFVAEGGYLWADGRCAFLDEHVYLRHANPGHGLDELFGCHEADFVVARGDVEILFADGSKGRGLRHEQYLKPGKGSVIAKFSGGQPAIVRNKFGRGVAELAGSYVTLGLRAVADGQTMRHLASFAFEAGVKPVLEIEPRTGFEASLLCGPEFDVMILSNHSGSKAMSSISAPSPYRSVSCPMGGSAFDGKFIQRNFNDLETAIFICEK